MGRKHQHDREERRERHAARQQRQSNKNKMIAAGVFGVVIAVISYAAYEFTTLTEGVPGAPEGAGPLNSAHVHAGILVKIFNDEYDFSPMSYQTQSAWIHFEGGNGYTIHRHATGVTLGYLFDSLPVELTDECYVFPNGREFCTNDEYSLKFYINGQQEASILDHIVAANDRILITYGSESEGQITEYLRELDSIPLDIR